MLKQRLLNSSLFSMYAYWKLKQAACSIFLLHLLQTLEKEKLINIHRFSAIPFPILDTNKFIFSLTDHIYSLFQFSLSLFLSLNAPCLRTNSLEALCVWFKSIFFLSKLNLGVMEFPSLTDLNVWRVSATMRICLFCLSFPPKEERLVFVFRQGELGITSTALSLTCR